MRRLAALTVLTLAASAARPAGAAPAEARQAAQAIERMLQRHGADVHRCFEKALADRLDVTGKVEIEADVGPGSKVTKTRVLAQGKEISPGLSACVQTAAAAWRAEGIEPGASIVLPFAFAGQLNQFVVNAEDVPDRGPQAPKGKGPPRQPPFTVKVLADEQNVRARDLSVTLLTVGPASRVAMHRHPRSAKALYLLKGHARLLGPPGRAPERLDEGSVAFVPAGYPHVIENMGRQATAVFLQVFAPPGPERVYRDPADPQGRADFEVIRDARAAQPPAGVKLVVRQAGQAEALPLAGGSGTVRLLLEPAVTGSPAFSLGLVEFAPGSEVPRHSHAGATEVLYVLSGGGTLTVGSESFPFAAGAVLHLPPDQPHGAKIGPGDKTVAVQLYAPAGPEQRFKTTK